MEIDAIKDISTFVEMLENHNIKITEEKDKINIDKFLTDNSLLDGKLFYSTFVIINGEHEFSVKDISYISGKNNKIHIEFKHNSPKAFYFDSSTVFNVVFLFIRVKMHLFNR